MSDKVHISGLQGTAIVGHDHWQKPVPQPIVIDVTFSTDFAQASDADDLHFSLNYAVISNKIARYLTSTHQRNFHSLGGLGQALMSELADERAACSAVNLKVAAPKLDIRSVVSYSSSIIESEANTDAKENSSSFPVEGVYRIEGLRALALIGVFTFEREAKQYVVVDVDMGVKGHLDVSRISEGLHSFLERTNFKTVEALIKACAQWVLSFAPETNWAAVRVAKPNAIVYTDSVGVSGKYTRADFADMSKTGLESPESPYGAKSAADAISTTPFDLPVTSPTSFSGQHTVYVAFGSNEGSPTANIARALQLINDHPQMHVDAVSALYVSKPMYVTAQSDFYNGVARVVVRDMAPHDVLSALKHIEYNELSRVKVVDNGPRTIDLDIVLYGKACVNTQDLIVPHRAMLSRTFVLAPLCELLPPDFVHPVTAEPVHDHWAKLRATPADSALQESPVLEQVVPGSGERSLRLGPQRATHIMAIFNATPDSFSDGGMHCDLTEAEIQAVARGMVEQGATIIDVGGCSTRPGSTQPSADEETRRVVRVVRSIRAARDLDSVLLSIDTYRAGVAQAALAEGADIINDVSMGTHDAAIFDVVASSGCGYVLSHSRGTPATMAKLTDYSYSGDDNLVEYWIGAQEALPETDRAVVQGVCRELARQVCAAEARGVRKWQMILDPGVGFAKNTQQNLSLLRHASRLKQYAQLDTNANRYTSFQGMPVLLGTSRKKFLGEITGTSRADERVVASAAAVVASVQQGADVVRVHDVRAAREAAQTADAIFRGVH
ncbi:dihydropteroate synthase [Clavispora lusitaniae]|uniref:Pterin-binding domain-containing protein n=1 Tax=Clavispora lusitaniae (strain ATCC 42720) TaxID=306902 RepID=C4Y5F2_CLAL4|nr:uncharacterized protein CLUG_03386 [Clavispora lusitaniae ATCC 42720]EEQ39258.1 hypothetical protein CLUG_03386 [Clavispora lusitaniae ATCC 42720]KAF5210165.1 trifunctional dihydropteroate synthetase [Clavispora lusitaniae]KAF7582762.1 dihydropteroate synthase [Clavispora lusitaniae]